MLPLTPWLLVSNAIMLTALEPRRKPKEAADSRPSVHARAREASLGFVNFLGFWSHYSPGAGCSSWPLPLAAPIAELTEFAEEQLVVAPRPQTGDVFLLGAVGGSRHVLAGIITAVERVTTMLNDEPAFVCMTVEGAVGAMRRDATAPRISARQVRRLLSPAHGDCFIRWCDLAAAASPAIVEYRLPKNLISGRRATADDDEQREAA